MEFNGIQPFFSELILCVRNIIFQEDSMLILTKRSISLEDVGGSVRKMRHCLEIKWNHLVIKSAASSCFCFAMKTCRVESGATGQDWIPYSWYPLTRCNISKQKRLRYQIFSTKLNFPSWSAGLLWGPCRLFLPDVQTWIRTVYTQDPTLLCPIHTYTYIYIYIYYSLKALRLLSLKTKSNTDRCLK